MGTIYKWTNQKNFMVYIGKTKRDYDERRKEHIRKSSASLLSEAIDEYGIENFTFEILHDGIIPELLDTYEKEEIAKHNCVKPNGYNKTSGGGGVVPSEEISRKISEAISKKFRESPEIWREAQRKATEAATKQNTGKKHSEERKKKQSIAMKGKHKGRIPHNKSPLYDNAEAVEGMIRLHTIELKTCSEIASIYSTTQNVVKNILNANGITMTNHSCRRKRSDIWNHPDEVIRLYTIDFKSLKEIADMFEVGSRTVIKVLKSNDVEIRKTRKVKAWNYQDKINSLYTIERKTIAEIADMFNTSSDVIQRILKSNNIVPRDNTHPDKERAREFFFSLPSEMDIFQKMDQLRQTFTHLHRDTIRRWTKRWHIELTGSPPCLSTKGRKTNKPPWNRRPEYEPAKDFFLSLPSDMPLSEKRKVFREKYPQIVKGVRNQWTRQWQSERTPKGEQK